MVLVKYQLFGVDIICNNNLECYLLEINKNPNMLNYHCKEEFQEKYDRWTDEINETVKRNSIYPKRINKSKKIKVLHKARRSIKTKMKKGDLKERKKLIRRIKLIQEYIKDEEKQQFKRKINKVVEKLKKKEE